MEHPAGTVTLELAAIDDVPGGSRDASFSLLFRAGGHEYIPQATYRMRHDALGVLDIFLVPIRRDTQGVYYEALFNRSVPRSAESLSVEETAEE